MNPDIRPFTADDIPQAIALWRATPGVGCDPHLDTPEGLHRYLERNPGLSRMAVTGTTVIGTLLAGHDGRRGYLHHLAVTVDHREKDCGRRLVTAAMSGLAAIGILKAHAFVFAANTVGLTFWERIGWLRHHDLEVVSGTS